MKNASLRADSMTSTGHRRMRGLLSCLAFAMLPGHAASVIDGTTGLQWDACAFGQSAGAGASCVGNPAALTWQQALAAARAANAALYQGSRRLARAQSHRAGIDRGHRDRSGQRLGVFWSSTSHQGDPTRAWTVDFGDGASHPSDKSNTFALRLVRGGELTLSASGERRYVRYGQTIDAIVMLANTGESDAGVVRADFVVGGFRRDARN